MDTTTDTYATAATNAMTAIDRLTTAPEFVLTPDEQILRLVLDEQVAGDRAAIVRALTALVTTAYAGLVTR